MSVSPSEALHVTNLVHPPGDQVEEGSLLKETFPDPHDPFVIVDQCTPEPSKPHLLEETSVLSSDTTLCSTPGTTLIHPSVTKDDEQALNFKAANSFQTHSSVYKDGNQALTSKAPKKQKIMRTNSSHSNLHDTQIDPDLNDTFHNMPQNICDAFSNIGFIPTSITTLSNVDRPFSLRLPIDPSWKISHIVDWATHGVRKKSLDFYLVSFINQPPESDRWMVMTDLRKLPGFTESIDRKFHSEFQKTQSKLRTK
jgi:hypothetical protein